MVLPADHPPESPQENHHHGSNPTAVDEFGIWTEVPVSRISEIPPQDETSPSDLDQFFRIDSPADDDLQNQVVISSIKKSRNSDGGDDQQKTKRQHDAEASTSAAAKKNKKKKRSNEDEQRPLIPLEEFGGLIRMVESRGGKKLYEKKLSKSDVAKNLNRVFLSKGESAITEFLTDEEMAAVNGAGDGLTVVGVDGKGHVYEKLVLKRWESLNMIVIKSDWRKVVAANNEAEEGVLMEIWGYKEDEKSCLAFNFKKERDGDGDGDGGDAAASSSTNGVVA